MHTGTFLADQNNSLIQVCSAPDLTILNVARKAMTGEGGGLVAKLTRDSKVVTEVIGEKVREDRGGGLASRHVRLLYSFSLLSFGEF